VIENMAQQGSRDSIFALTFPVVNGIAIAGSPNVTACSPIKITFPFASPCVVHRKYKIKENTKGD
jgi:hypothetical protein